jgi:hypothetical protein
VSRERLMRVIARHKEMASRAARMITAHENGLPLPDECLFAESEMKELDEFLSDVWAEETGTTPKEGRYTPPVRQAYSTKYWKSDDQIAWLRAFKVSLDHSRRHFETLLASSGDIHLGDRYEVSNSGQLGSVGPNASLKGSTFEQTWLQIGGEVDLGVLADELSLLRSELRKSASSISEDAAVAAVASAEGAALANDGASVMRHLKAAGQWAFDIATKIGTTIAAKAIEKAIWP